MDRNFQRLLDLLSVLQRSERLSTADIRERLAARGHAVTARTVQRDLESLASAYPLDCDTSQRPYTWAWRRDAARISLPGMDWPEAVSFQMLATYLEGALPACVREGIQPYVQQARHKLTQHFEDLPLRRWPERVRVLWQGPPVLAPGVDAKVHLAVTQAVLLGQCLRLRYRAFGAADGRSYEVAPLGLVLLGPIFYLPVRFEGFDDVRTLVLHRIQTAELMAKPSGIEGFDLEGWIGAGGLGFGGHEEVGLELRLWERLGDLLKETPLAADQRVLEQDDGSQLLQATVRDTAQLRRWLLSLGARAEVLAPAGLRAAMRDTFSAASARYGV